MAISVLEDEEAPSQITMLRHELGDERMTIMRPNWAQMVQEMVHVRLSVRYWRAQERLSLEDLGLENATAEFRAMAAEYLRLGHQQLMPGELLKSLHCVEEKARQSCGRHGIKSPWNGYLILKRKYPAWREEVEALQQEFYTLRDRICRERDQWVEELLTRYEEKEVQAAAVRAGVLPELAFSCVDRSEIQQRLQRIRSAIPSAEVIYAKFFLDWAPSLVERPEVLADGIDVQELERRRDEAQSVLANTQREITQTREQWQRNAEWEEQQQSLRANAERLRAETLIQQDAQRKATEIRTREFQDLATDVAARCRQMMAEVAAGIHKSLGKSGRVYPQQLRALRGLVDDLQAFNVMGDQEIDAIARRVQDLTKDVAVDPDGGKAALKQGIEDLLFYSRMGLRILDREDRFDRDPDLPDPSTVPYQARMDRFTTARERLTAPPAALKAPNGRRRL